MQGNNANGDSGRFPVEKKDDPMNDIILHSRNHLRNQMRASERKTPVRNSSHPSSHVHVPHAPTGDHNEHMQSFPLDLSLNQPLNHHPTTGLHDLHSNEMYSNSEVEPYWGSSN